MRYLSFITVVTVFLSFAVFGSAKADRPGALSYTAIGNKQAPAQKRQGTLNIKSIQPPEVESVKKIGAESDTPEEPETPSSRVWKKYKALATGKSEDTNKDAEDLPVASQAKEIDSNIKPVKPIEPIQNTPPPQGAQTSDGHGFASILQEYRRAKEQRKGVRTLTVTPSDTDIPEPEKTN